MGTQSRLNGLPSPPEQLVAVALKRDEHNYVLVYTAPHVAAARQQLRRWAADPGLNFTPDDIGRLTAQMEANCG